MKDIILSALFLILPVLTGCDYLEEYLDGYSTEQQSNDELFVIHKSSDNPFPQFRDGSTIFGEMAPASSEAYLAPSYALTLSSGAGCNKVVYINKDEHEKVNVGDFYCLRSELTGKRTDDAFKWQCIINAIIWVESNGMKDVVSSSGKYVGIMQIGPDYVKEANNIIGREKYTVANMSNPFASIEVFEIVNGKHNPQQSPEKAIQLHNSGNSAYKSKVLDIYRKLLSK